MAFHPKELLCSKCNMYSPSRQSCLEHVKICKQSIAPSMIASENSVVSCFICKKSFSDKLLLSEHFLKAYQIRSFPHCRGFVCTNCNDHFTTKNSCLKHVKICKQKLDQSKIAPKKAFPCDKCGLTPHNKQQMLIHLEKCTNIQAKENLVEKAITMPEMLQP